jgi:membrane fusion protein, copper/silver efflux system
MSPVIATRSRLAAAATLIALVAGGLGFGIARLSDGTDDGTPAAVQGGRRVLYWYDPMVPLQHFDKPGKSPFMDMDLVPKYADETSGDAPGIRIDPAPSQNLGLRTVAVRRGELISSLTATGTIDFNQRDVAIVQARAAGFVQRVYGRAPGDIVRGGAPLADILVPEWAGAQAEYLAVRRAGDAGLARAARQRLMLLGMPAGTIAAVEGSGRPHNIVTISTPTGGVIKTLGVRAGMSVMAGQTLAEVNGLGTVWLNAAVPEAVAGQLRPGQTAQATLAAYPGETFAGRIAAILPETQSESRTLTVRIELPNRGGRLRPGMFASVAFAGTAQPALLVPSEAVIRTGRRTLVMLALDKGRYQPAEVRTGRESGNETEILAGLREGEKIVASGQFLLDSEASLSGVEARPIGSPPVAAPGASPKPMLYESVGRIEKITPDAVTLSHEPIPALRWPAMTMSFRLGEPGLARGFKAGDRIRFAFDQPPAGPTLRRLTKAAGQ